jgi:hypothetical protein
VTDDPEAWASILGWHCWRDAAGTWHARQADASPATLLRAGSLDALRAQIDQYDHRVASRCEPVPDQTSVRSGD